MEVEMEARMAVHPFRELQVEEEGRCMGLQMDMSQLLLMR
jgi:hypothetical protein